MPRITFTGNLRSHIDAPPAEVRAGTVREALEQVFARNPRLRSYVLDDQGGVRRHVVIFVGGEPIRDRAAQSDAATGEIAVMQALSGG
jgi:hypothetical protein